MKADAMIHWHEGLFLQPHHLQQMQRRLTNNLQALPARLTPFPYGVVQCRFSGDELANKRLRIDTLHAVMPSGLEVSFPGNAVLESISFAHEFNTSGEALTVYLAVPIWHETTGNSIEQGDAETRTGKRLYYVDEEEVRDENTGDNPQAMRVRKINARLLLEGQDTGDLEVLPILRIVRDVGDDVGTPRPDPAFIPPCLHTAANPRLQRMVRDLTNVVDAARTALVEQNVIAELRKDTVRGPQLEQFLRLQCLSRFSARLNQCLRNPVLTPFEFDGILRELLAEISAIKPELAAFDVADYDHDNPGPVFRELMRLVHQALQGQVAEMFIKVPFTKKNKRFFATLKPEHFDLPTAYYLGIQSKKDSRTVATLVEDANRFKLLPASMQEAAIFGIGLAVDHSPPVELPSPGKGLLYFRLQPEERARLWAAIRQEKEVVIDGPSEEMSDFTMTLYMLLPEQGGAS